MSFQGIPFFVHLRVRGAGDITADNSFLISPAIVFPSLIFHDEYYFYICGLIIKY